jgi:uncharacterized membrane protein
LASSSFGSGSEAGRDHLRLRFDGVPHSISLARSQCGLRSAFVIGSMRTMQQDVEFGVLQIVDIALKAISPAVNDPSTAINCVDQLTRILIRWTGRAPPVNLLSDPPHVVRVIIPWTDFDHLLDTAFEQIRHYAVNDIAVSLRLLRALSDLSTTTEDERMREQLVLRGRRIVAGCTTRIDASDFKRLESRLAELEARTPATTLNALDGPQAT